MTVEDRIGRAAQFSSSVLSPERVSESLFIADGREVYPLSVTREKFLQIVKFIRGFPLSTSWNMSDEEIYQFVMAPDNVFLETSNGLFSFEGVHPRLDAHVGFIFWDRKVAGNDKLLRDIFRQVVSMFQLRRLSCYVVRKNRTMSGLLEKAGFSWEGQLRQAFILPNGVYDDLLIYGILAEELIDKPVEPETTEMIVEEKEKS